MRRTLLAALAVAAFAYPAVGQTVTTPAEHLGRPLGADFELADWDEVSGYFRKLAAESPRVLVETAGTTTEGRDFLLAVISSEENLAQLDQIRADARRIADPRGLDEEEKEALVRRARPLLFISNAMHSTETAAPQFGMEFAHLLATSDEEPFAAARERLVVLMAPCLNPDGLDHVVSWYRETVGTPYEGSGLLKLYQRYAGHDNNRDWFMLSQAETRIITRLLYSVWYPQVYWDVHQQGRSGERLFVPPFRDPLNPNLDPAIIAGIDALGSRALLDMTAEGFAGVSTGVTYDMWWNGGNRNVPVRHNIIGLLTEAASVNVASPVFLPREELAAPRGIAGGYAPSNRFPMPWPGGWWRLQDIIDYELAFGRSLLGSLAREPETWLWNALGAAERALEPEPGAAPRAWILPATNPDRGAVRRLVEALLLCGVEIGVARDALTADGRTWPAGSLVIDRRQPYGAHVKDLFDVQRYPDGDPPYDVAGWTLPLLLGVHRVEVMEEIAAERTPITRAEEALAGFPDPTADDGRLDARDSDTWPAVFRRLAAGQAVTLVSAGERAGSFVDAKADGEDGLTVEQAPRIGLYSPWSGNMDEGWMRFVLDTFAVPYAPVRNEALRAGRLADFLDVLILPGVPGRQLDHGRSAGSVPARYAGGLDPEGAVAVEEFVRAGGTLVAVGGSSRWAIDLLGLPLEDVTLGDAAGEFSCPGSVLRGIPAHVPANSGLPDSVGLFFARSAAWKVKEAQPEPPVGKVTALLRYAPSRTLLSGWIRRPEVIGGQVAWARVDYGRGIVHLFAFEPQYRSWSQGTFPLLFRALLFRT